MYVLMIVCSIGIWWWRASSHGGCRHRCFTKYWENSWVFA